MTRIDDPLHDREAGQADATQDTTRIDDVRIGAVRPLISPALLQDELPVSAPLQALVEGGQPRAHRRRAARPRRPAGGGGRPLLHPRPRTGHGVRAPAQGGGRHAGRRPAHRHARVLREAAHHRGLEGLHQRSAPGRQFPHQRRPAPRAPPAAGNRRPGTAHRHRIPGPAQPAIHRRPDRLGRDRRAHHRKPQPPATGLGPELPAGFQERHRRRHPGGGRRHRGRQRPACLHGHDQDGHRRHLRDARQRRHPRHPARRQARPQLRRGRHRRLLCGAGQGRPARAGHGRLLARQFEQVAREPVLAELAQAVRQRRKG
ncbi:phospho-2-dehydro-3-deoxyheptonate aldolase [Bordetella pertussis]|nr:phospho-2-dehydro-3-deoxyheptonate aldolase [Bordetella pertussis]